MNDFQNRLERCSMGCQDSVKDKFGALEQNSPKVPAAQKQLLGCMASCVDKHIAMLKSVQYKIQQDIDKAVK